METKQKNEVTQKDKAVRSIMDKFTSAMKKIDFNPSAKEAADIKKKLDEANSEICCFSDFYGSSDPMLLEIKKIEKSINNIFNKMNPFRDVI
ncbi:MAG: hypothetical protein ACXV8Q_04190 [Methylobacter sp.]